MNIKNAKKLLQMVSKAKDFDWQKPQFCLGHHAGVGLALDGEKIPNHGFFCGGLRSIESFFEIPRMEAQRLFFPTYPMNGKRTDYEGLAGLNKEAAMRLLKTTIKLARVPGIDEFHFIETDFKE